MGNPQIENQGGHLTESEVSGYLSGIHDEPRRRLIQTHLSSCDECSREVAEVWRLSQSREPIRMRRPARKLVVAAAGIAAALAIILWPAHDQSDQPRLRDPAQTFAAPPTPLMPKGRTHPPIILQWNSVPHAASYQVVVYDSEGSVVWEARVRDTMAALPDTARLVFGSPYLWKVEAETGWGRSAESPLTEFELLPPRRP